MTPRSIRLGCLPHSADKFARLPPARYGAVLPPPSVPLPSWQPKMGGNDARPVCTTVALWNAGRAWSERWGHTDLTVPQTAIDGLYAAAIGQPNATLDQLAATDGADPMMVVETAQARGWDVGAEVPLVPDFATVAPNRYGIAGGIARSGSVMLALTLYPRDMDDFEAGRLWVEAPTGTAEGGHMVAVCAYAGMTSGDFVQLATWGKWQPATWFWVGTRLRLGLLTGWRQMIGGGVDYAAAWGGAGG